MTLLGAKLMLVEGSIQRESEHAEVPITHVICKRLLDRTDLLNSLRQGDTATAWGDAALARAHEVRRPNSSSGSLGSRSRDFH